MKVLVQQPLGHQAEELESDHNPIFLDGDKMTFKKQFQFVI
jgi:hypothetical protein